MIKKQATTGLKKLNGQNRELGNIEMLGVDGWIEGRGEGEIGEMRFQSMWKMGKDFCPHFIQHYLNNMNKEGLFQYLTAPTEKADPLSW